MYFPCYYPRRVIEVIAIRKFEACKTGPLQFSTQVDKEADLTAWKEFELEFFNIF